LNKATLVLIFISILVACAQPESNQDKATSDSTQTNPVVDTLFGFNPDSFIVRKGVIKRNQFLADILLEYDVPYATIHEIGIKSKDVYDVRKLARNKPYTVLCKNDSAQIGQVFIYQPNDIDYVIYDFRRDSILISEHKKDVSLVEKEFTGQIKTSLYESLQDSGQNVMLAFEMADIFAWSIDFYRLQKGDYYTVIFDEIQVEEKFIDIGRIKAVLFNHEGREFFAYYFEQDSIGGDYFDEAAGSLRKAFLKSPLKFSRLTSGYTRRRFHPVQKRWKAHLGTDYAAPRGTPIMSTGDGKVIEATYKKYNGNYVKIKHNSVYMTQYLHMNKIKSGIKPGLYVKQGDIIGYVGSTGLATGPHVCYRFWKNKAQVNHLNEDFPPSEPVREENMGAYYDYIRPFQERLQSSRVDMDAPQYLQ
jgi:murein DD-endopeptidase MepM/ murein hydrolase activator NlpD